MEVQVPQNCTYTQYLSECTFDYTVHFQSVVLMLCIYSILVSVIITNALACSSI